MPAAVPRAALDRFALIGEDACGIPEHAADEGGLAIINAAAREHMQAAVEILANAAFNGARSRSGQRRAFLRRHHLFRNSRHQK